MRHHHFDGIVLFLRNRLRFDAGFDLAVHKVLHKRPNGLLGNCFGLVKGELLVLDGFLNGKGRPLLLQVEISGVSTKRFGINGGEANDTFMLLGEGLQGLG